MSVLARLASSLGRNDEVPNVQLAEAIAKKGDKTAVRELVEHLSGKDRAIQNDAVKVLYEVGGRRPQLISPYADAFVDQLAARNNRMVWGAMTALGTIAPMRADALWKRVGEIQRANDAGSVITQDWGIRVLAAVASAKALYERKLFPYLLAFLERCIPRDVPKHAESILVAVNDRNKDAFLRVLKVREKHLKPTQMTRLRKVYKRLG